jgi:2-oxoisovalerate dehydrogenase E1 component
MSVLDGYETAALIREVEQRLLALFGEGKLFGTVHTCIGQEWTGVAVAAALKPDDLVFSNHRCHGHFIARTGEVDGLIAEIMGKQSGVCGGRGGSQHLCSREHGFFSNGVLGGIVPVSAGLAFSLELRKSDGIAVVFIGDGTLGEGVVYETLNIASKWSLPLLLVLENNRYAQSTPQQQNLAGEIRARAAAFGIEARTGATGEPERLMAVAAECVARVRGERRPLLLEVDTYRLMGHSKGDDDRDPEEVAAHWLKDPLKRFADRQPEPAACIQERVKARVDEAVARAESAPYADRADPAPPPATRPTWNAAPAAPQGRMVMRIREALKRNLERDPRIVLIGEDIESPYGGAFKVTKGLSDEFPGRVRNTPVSEAAIVGIGNGLALGGLLPVCEIMFGDFLALAADQLINHASKFRYMYNHQVEVPLIVRTPMGGRRGYGPTHSQSLEKHFLGLPQTRMLALHGRCDPGAVYDRLFATIDRPTIVIENKLLYTAHLDAAVPPGFRLEQDGDPYPATRMRADEPAQVTVFCYGGNLPYVEQAVVEAFDEHEVAAEVICPLQLYPLNPWPVIESVERTGRLLIVEEGLGFAALGAELIAQISERAPGRLRQVRRLGPPEHPIPSCGPLENELLPNPRSIAAAVEELARRG